MRPWHALIFTAVIAVLLPFYYLVDRPEIKVAQATTDQESLLNLSDVNSIAISRPNEKIAYEKEADGRRYKLVEPEGKFIPQDLMQAMAQLLVQAKSVEVIATNPKDLSEYGLDSPRAEIVVSGNGHAGPIHIYLGADNPTKTAIYARIEGIPKVFLLGSNLAYYQSLMFQWVEGKQGKNA